MKFGRLTFTNYLRLRQVNPFKIIEEIFHIFKRNIVYIFLEFIYLRVKFTSNMEYTEIKI